MGAQQAGVALSGCIGTVLEFVCFVFFWHFLSFLVIGVLRVNFRVGSGWVEVPAFFGVSFGYLSLIFPYLGQIVGIGGHGWWKSDGSSMARGTQTDYALMEVDG